jgi:hypothetical protein
VMLYTPRIRIKSAKTTNVYGRRSASRTIHIRWYSLLRQNLRNRVLPDSFQDQCSRAGRTDVAAVARDARSLRLNEAICQLAIGRGTPRKRGGPFKAKAARCRYRAGGKEPASPEMITVEQTILFDNARPSESALCMRGKPPRQALQYRTLFPVPRLHFAEGLFQHASWSKRIWFEPDQGSFHRVAGSLLSRGRNESSRLFIRMRTPRERPIHLSPVLEKE